MSSVSGNTLALRPAAAVASVAWMVSHAATSGSGEGLAEREDEGDLETDGEDDSDTDGVAETDEVTETDGVAETDEVADALLPPGSMQPNTLDAAVIEAYAGATQRLYVRHDPAMNCVVHARGSPRVGTPAAMWSQPTAHD
jgi:hypothetical protein